MTRAHFIAAASAAAVLVGCGVEPSPGAEPALGSSSQMQWGDLEGDVGVDAAASSSVPLDDQGLNGTEVEVAAPLLQGCDLSSALRGTPLPTGCSNNGPLRSSPLAWVRLDGITLKDGSVVTSAALDGTSLTGVANGVRMSGEDFEQATFLGVATSGASVQLRLEHLDRGRHHQEEVWRYEFQYLTAKGDWKHLCTGGKEAVVVSGRWDFHQGVTGDGAKIDDPTVFTVGCRRSAIEKCVNGGYWPWAVKDGLSLDPYHQACVRMLRADYCGDAVAHTIPGRKVDLYDRIGIQRDTEHWVLEAEWTPAGASCLNTLNLTPADAPCLAALGSPLCGQASSLANGTLIVSETPHTGGRF